MEIDYSKYSLEELYDVERNIDAQAHTSKYRQILKQISIKKSELNFIKSTSADLTSYSSYMEDPIAQKISWTPLVRGGSNFATHVLDDFSRSQIRVKPSLGLYLFTLLFSGFSFIFIFKAENGLIDKGEWPTDLDQYMQTFVPFIFVGASFYLLYKLSENTVFDKKRGR